MNERLCLTGNRHAVSVAPSPSACPACDAQRAVITSAVQTRRAELATRVHHAWALGSFSDVVVSSVFNCHAVSA